MQLGAFFLLFYILGVGPGLALEPRGGFAEGLDDLLFRDAVFLGFHDDDLGLFALFGDLTGFDFDGGNTLELLERRTDALFATGSGYSRKDTLVDDRSILLCPERRSVEADQHDRQEGE